MFQPITKDKDDSLHGTPRYLLLSGNEEETFYLDAVQGRLVLKSPLDRESVDHYNISLRVEDSEPGSPDVKYSDIMVYIRVLDVNDNEPVCTPVLYYAKISEGKFCSSITAVRTKLLNIYKKITSLQ